MVYIFEGASRESYISVPEVWHPPPTPPCLWENLGKDSLLLQKRENKIWNNKGWPWGCNDSQWKDLNGGKRCIPLQVSQYTWEGNTDFLKQNMMNVILTGACGQMLLLAFKSVLDEETSRLQKKWWFWLLLKEQMRQKWSMWAPSMGRFLCASPRHQIFSGWLMPFVTGGMKGCHVDCIPPSIKTFWISLEKWWTMKNLSESLS